MERSIANLVCAWIGLLFFFTGCDRPVNDVPYEIWVIHSYEKDCPWMEEMNKGITDAFRREKVKVNLRYDYLSSYYSQQACEDTVSAWMNRRKKKPDLILTVHDQATAAVIRTRHPLLQETEGVPVVYCGVEYPDSLPSVEAGRSFVSGFITRVNFEDALELGKIIRKTKVYMPLTYHNIGYVASGDIVSQIHRLADMVIEIKIDTMSEQTSYHDVFYKIVEERFRTFGILPEWDPLAAKCVSSSATPFIALSHKGFGQGFLGGYFTSSYQLAYDGAKRAARLLKQDPGGGKVQESERKLWIDWALYYDLGLPFERLPEDVEFIHIPFTVKYKTQLQIAAVSGVFLFTVLLVFIFYKIRTYRRQKRENEYELIQQRDNLLVVTNSIDEGIVTIDQHGLIRSANLRARQLLCLGDIEKDYLHTPLADWVQLIEPAADPATGNLLDRVYREKQPIAFSPQTRIRCRKSDHYFLATGEVVPMIRKGEVKGAICIFSDHTDEFTTGEYLSLTTNAGQLFFWRFDFHTSRFVFNPAFFTQWGIADDGTHSLPLDAFVSFIHPDDVEAWQRFYAKQHLSPDMRLTREIRMNLNGRGEQYWEVRMSCHLHGEDPLPVLYGLCIHIQDYKDKQARLQEARDHVQRSEQLKSAFLSNMSHEIRTPLNGIIGFAKLIAGDETYEPEEYELFIHTIQSNCNLLLGLIDDILDLARIDSNSMVYTDTDCNLSSLIVQVMTTQQVILQKPLQLIRRLPAEPVYVKVDKLRLTQVITNLVNNAVKFTDQGSITVGYTADDTHVSITVADTGMGIPPEEQALIFERFYKKHNDIQGAGIGLNLCKNIVEHYHGTLSVASEVGQGTVFTVKLPLKGTESA